MTIDIERKQMEATEVEHSIEPTIRPDGKRQWCCPHHYSEWLKKQEVED